MSDRSRVTFTDVRALDPESAAVVEGDVVVEDGTILELGSSGPVHGRTVAGRGRTAIPGMIDAHFHAFAATSGGLELEWGSPSYLAIAASVRLAGALRRGFTTVRDPAGGNAGFGRALREGLVTAPRYLYTGLALSQTGGHGDPRPAELDVSHFRGQLSEVVDGVDELRRAVRERFRSGAHAIKLLLSGGVASPTDPLHAPQYSSEEVLAVVDEATRRGSYVAAHAYSAESITHAVINGVRSIEHGNLIDDPAAALMAERGAILVSTLGAYDAIRRRADELSLPDHVRQKNAEVLSAGHDSLAIAMRHGVPIAFGSDNMGAMVADQLCGIRLHLESRDALDVLRTLTSVGANLILRPDLGRLRPGMIADMVILDGDPMKDSSVLWDEQRARLVVQGGVVVP